MSFTYDADGHLTKVTDGAGHATALTYASGLLTKVTPPDGLAVAYSYTSSRLTKITYADGKTSTYQYDAAGNLTGFANHDGYRIAYTYDGASPARVTSVQEYGGSEKGGSLRYSYGWNVTKTTDGKGRTSLVRFNDNGQALSVQDAEGDAAYVGYGEEQGKKQELTNASQVFRSAVNLLDNPSIQKTAAWSLEGEGASYAWSRVKAGAPGRPGICHHRGKRPQRDLPDPVRQRKSW